MDPFELAAKLKAGRTLQSETGSSEEVAALGTVQVVSGTAETDSAAGYVTVNLGGSSVTQDGTQAIECPTDVSVRSGQEVAVQIVDGKPRVTGIIGWGDEISGRVGDAQTIAAQAEAVANAVNQHFWTDNQGAHVTEVTKGEWNDQTSSNYHKGANSLWNSLGMLIRKGLNNLLSITEGAITFFDGNGNAAENIMAYFGSTSARIGYEGQGNITIDTDSIDFNEGGETVAQVINSDVLAGISIPNSGKVVGGKTESGLWITGTGDSGRVSIGSGKGRPSTEELQISNQQVNMVSGMSPSAVTFELGPSRETSGNIYIDGEYRRRTNINLDIPADEAIYRTVVRGQAAGGAIIGYMGVQQQPTGSIGMSLNATRSVNGTQVYNGVTFGIDNAGNRTVSLSAPKQWNNALRTQLYNNNTGSNGTITLSQSAANFDHLTIYYRDNDNEFNSVDVYQPNGKMVALASYHPGYNNGALYLKTRSVTINGTTISTTSLNRYSQVAIEPTMTAQKNNLIYITRVEGW